MLSNFKNIGRSILPIWAREKLDNHSVSRKFRKLYRDWAVSSKRLRGLEGQQLLRETFIRNGMIDLEWALRQEQSRRTFTVSSCIDEHEGIGLKETDIKSAVTVLQKDGLWICPIRMSNEWVSEVVDNLNELSVTCRSNATDIQKPSSIRPQGTTYWHAEQDLEKVPLLRSLIKDHGLYEVIGRYLGCIPVYDFPAAWWSYPGPADSASAQMFHFDLDRVRWLKVFVYLTDVGPQNGPHVFIKGSHRVIGDRIKRDGRFTDEEAKKLFPDLECVELTAPSGTLFIEDTLGFHKGSAVQADHRCVFEFEYSCGHFGYPYPVSPFDVL
jgi:hypothetical protein